MDARGSHKSLFAKRERRYCYFHRREVILFYFTRGLARPCVYVQIARDSFVLEGDAFFFGGGAV